MSDIRQTSIHESGHACVAFALGVPFKQTSVVPDGHPDNLGHVLFANSDSYYDFDAYRRMPAASANKLVDESVLIKVAGIVAVQILNDYIVAPNTDREAVESLRMLRIRHSVQDARPLLAAPWDKCAGILRKRWPALLRLASALEKHGILDGFDCRVILSGIGKGRRTYSAPSERRCGYAAA